MKRLKPKYKIKDKQLFTALKCLTSFPKEYTGYICGGFSKYLVSPNFDSEFSDIDIFYRQLPSSIPDVVQSLGGQIYNQPEPYGPVSSLRNVRLNDFKIQLCKMEVDVNCFHDVVDTFDFTVCRAYYNPHENYVIVDNDFEEHERSKQLVLRKTTTSMYDSDNYAVYRILKYIDKGYDMSNCEFTKWLGYIDNKKHVADLIKERLTIHKRLRFRKVSFRAALNLARMTI